MICFSIWFNCSQETSGPVRKGTRVFEAFSEWGCGIYASITTLSNWICLFLMCDLLRRDTFFRSTQGTKYTCAKLEQKHLQSVNQVAKSRVFLWESPLNIKERSWKQQLQKGKYKLWSLMDNDSSSWFL